MKWLIAVITALHGLIHLMGFVNGTGIKKLEGFTGDTTVALSNNLGRSISYLWILPAVLFLTTVAGFLANTDWWKPLALVSIVISQALIFIWWHDAKVGTAANIIVLIVVVLWNK